MLQTMIREWRCGNMELHLKVVCPVHGCSAEMEVAVTDHAADQGRAILLEARQRHLAMAHPKN